MYYYLQEKNEIKKYKINIDINKLEELRTEIINNCSYLFHREYRSTILPHNKDFKRIKNYTYKKIGVREYTDGPDEDLYLISYDEVEYPTLVSLIDRLLKNDFSVLNEIYLDEEEKQNLFDKKIKDIENEIAVLTSKREYLKVKEKISEMENIILESKKNSERRQYYERVKNLISFELIDTIRIEEINRVRKFYEQELLETRKDKSLILQ